jgi:ankyrin repeat protein
MPTDAAAAGLDRDTLAKRLCQAAYSNDSATIADLAPYADLEHADNMGDTPLCVASLMQSYDAVNALLKAGANPYFRSAPWIKNEYPAPLRCFVLFGQASLVREALRRHQYADLAGDGGLSLISLSIVNKQIEVLRALLDGGARHSQLIVSSSVVDPTNEPGRASLLCAARPMHFAVMDDISYMQVLYGAGASVNVANSDGHSPLHSAAQTDLGAACSWLVEHGAMLEAPLPGSDHTPLMLATIFDRAIAAEVLLKAGANRNARSSIGLAPLHLACMSGSAACARLLVKNGADINALTATKETPLMIAALRDQPEIVTLLLEAGAEQSGSSGSGVEFKYLVEKCSERVQQAYHRPRLARGVLSWLAGHVRAWLK